MDRRTFLKSVAGAAATAASAFAGLPVMAAALEAKDVPEAGRLPDLVAVRNGSPEKMFREGIEALGGMKSFVRPGHKVVVKPNAAFDLAPEYGANTQPGLMAEIVSQARAAGASEVSVFDHTLSNWRNAYENSGIQDAVVNAGGKMLPAHEERFYELRQNPKALRLKETAVFKPLLEADVVINVPVLKNHGGARMSSAIKNLMGAVWDRRVMHRNDLNQSIAEMLLYMKPTLNVVDAYRIMIANGPRGTGLDDVEVIQYQLLSRDIVAVDSVAAQIMGYKLADIRYIGIAEGLGFGTSDLSKVKISRITL